MKARKNQQLVERYIDAINDNHRDRIMSFFVENSVFENMSEQAQQLDWRVEYLEERESGSVFTQGCISYLLDGGWLQFEVNGLFEVKGRKIVRWH